MEEITIRKLFENSNLKVIEDEFGKAKNSERCGDACQ